MTGRLAALAAALCVTVYSDALGDNLADAPFQVEGLWQPAPASYGEDLSDYGEPLVAVDFGKADRRAPPDEDAYRHLQIVGTLGMARATKVEVRKTCDYLCGDEAGGATCHYSGLYSLQGDPAGTRGTLGLPIAAFPGETFAFRVADPVERRKTTANGLMTTFSAPAWTEHPEMQVRLSPADGRDGEKRAQVRFGDGPVNDYDVGSCEPTAVGPFVELACTGAAFLISEDRLLLASFADYNRASVRVVRRLEGDARKAYLVRLGLKAQDVFGVLWRDATGTWQGRFRPRDYDLLC